MQFSGTFQSMSIGRFESSIVTSESSSKDYGGYLHLDELLSLQQLQSTPPHHDEQLFIIQHQTSELWLKLIIHELSAAVRAIQQDELSPCFKILARVKQCQRILFEQWAVLETLTPSEYAEFRQCLGNASGLQSWQNRAVEWILGNKEPKMLPIFANRPSIYKELERLLGAPSIYDEYLFYLHRHGFPIPDADRTRNFAEPRATNPETIKVFEQIYHHPERHWLEYEMAEKLIDIDEYQALWRFRHLKTVERIIGFKPGTGGTSGASFLRKIVDIRLFPEIWDARTGIGSAARE